MVSGAVTGPRVVKGSGAQGGDGVQAPEWQQGPGPQGDDGAHQFSLNFCFKIFDEDQAELPETTRPFEQVKCKVLTKI